MSWFGTVLDAVPVVGTVYRAGNAVAAHVTGDHEEANRQWAEAGMNAAGDALGLVTGGAGKVATTAAKVGAKAAVKTAMKQGVKHAVKAGGRAAMKSASKQLTRSAMKSYAKRYFKRKIKRAVKEAIKEKMREFDANGYLDELIEIVADATGMSQYELEGMDQQEIYNLAYVAAYYEDE